MSKQIIKADGWYALFMNCESGQELKLRKIPLTGWQIQGIQNQVEEVKIIGLVLDENDGETEPAGTYDGFFFYYHESEPWSKVKKRAEDIYQGLLKVRSI